MPFQTLAHAPSIDSDLETDDDTVMQLANGARDTLEPDAPETTNNPEETVATLPSLYRHTKREEWGLGVVLEERVDRVTMQFQDGRTRAMHLDYWELIEPADRSYDLARALVTALEEMAPEELRRDWRKAPRPISLEEQTALFRELFPEGFRSAAYTEEHRTDGRKRFLKRHRDGMLAMAAQSLSRAALRDLEESEGATAVHDVLRRVLEVSSIVPAKERLLFAKLAPEHHARVADAVRGLLHGKAPVAQRLDSWVRTLELALGEAPSWELATYFLGAVHPDTLPMVHPSAFERQAQFMAPGLRVGSRPMGILYQRLVAMLTDVRARLREDGLDPRDLLDVHDFIYLTLKTAGRDRILAMRSEFPDATSETEATEDRAAA